LIGIQTVKSVEAETGIALSVGCVQKLMRRSQHDVLFTSTYATCLDFCAKEEEKVVEIFIW